MSLVSGGGGKKKSAGEEKFLGMLMLCVSRNERGPSGKIPLRGGVEGGKG